MKTRILRLLGVFLFSGLAMGSYAQEQPDHVYAEVACIKASGAGDLLAFMKEKGIEFNKKAQAKGAIMDWVFLETLYPNGEDCRCDYRSVTIFTDMKQLDMINAANFGPQTAGEAFGEKAQATWEEFNKLAHFKGAQVYELKYTALPGPSGANMSQLRILNVPAKNIQAYMEMEEKVWMPVVKKLVAQGMLKDWGVWERMYPTGEQYDGNVAMVADFDSFAHMNGIDMASVSKIFQEVHPGKNFMEAVQKMQSLSTTVSDETVRFVTSLSNPK